MSDSSIVLQESAEDPRVVRTRRDIADSVRAMIADEGWDSITHQRVAKHAGYARNTVYRHFPEREDLLIHAGAYDAEVCHIEVTGDTKADLIEELFQFRDLLFEGVHAKFLSAIVDRAERDPAIERIRLDMVTAGEEVMRQAIDNAIARGELRTSLQTTDITAQLAGPIVYARLFQNEPVSDDFIETLVDAVLASLEA